MKTFKEFYETIDESSKPNPVARRKAAARRMAKMAKSSVVKSKKARAKLKMRNPAKLKTLARKNTINNLRKKFFPKYDSMSIGQRVKVDQKIMQKYGAKIDKIAQRQLPQMQKAEVERVKKARESLKKDPLSPTQGFD